eukprot:6212031-Pleurochrysis_carterae.AAC.5
MLTLTKFGNGFPSKLRSRGTQRCKQQREKGQGHAGCDGVKLTPRFGLRRRSLPAATQSEPDWGCRETLGAALCAMNYPRSAHQEMACVVQTSLLHQHCHLQRAIALSSTGAQSTTSRCPHLLFRTAESLCRPIRY